MKKNRTIYLSIALTALILVAAYWWYMTPSSLTKEWLEEQWQAHMKESPQSLSRLRPPILSQTPNMESALDLLPGMQQNSQLSKDKKQKLIEAIQESTGNQNMQLTLESFMYWEEVWANEREDFSGPRAYLESPLGSTWPGLAIQAAWDIILYQPVNDADQAKRYLERMRAIPKQVDYTIQQVTQKGLDSTTASYYQRQLDLLNPKDFSKHPLYQAFAYKARNADFHTYHEEKAVLDMENLMGILEKDLYPSYQNLYSALSNNLQSVEKARSLLPKDQTAYRKILYDYTSLELNPDSLHQLRMEQLLQYRDSVLSYWKIINPSADSSDINMSALWKDSDWRYQDGTTGFQQMMQDFHSYSQKAFELSAGLLNQVPDQKPVIRALPPAFSELVGDYYYARPSLDGSRPGTVYINPNYLGQIQKWRIRSLVHASIAPGAHFMHTYRRDDTELKYWQKALVNSALAEGWPLFASELIYRDLEFFLDDQEARLGYWWQVFYHTMRSIIDTGISSKAWTKEEAISWGTKLSGLSEEEISYEVDRCIARPGFGTVACVGWHQMSNWQSRVKKVQGLYYVRQDFLSFLLKHADLPLLSLDKAIEDYIIKSMDI